MMSGDDAPLVNPTAAVVGADVAKRAQLRQMQMYVANVQGFFEGVLTDLLLQQPADPHDFLVKSLLSMPVNERDEIKAKLAAQDERKNNQEDANFNRAKNSVVVSLTLTVNDDPASKPEVVSILQGLQAFARSQTACQRFDIASNPDTTDLLVSQVWATQAGLDAYYASPAFQQATPRFRGLLVDLPDERVYHPV